jgi:hypothetical protein
LFDGAAVLHDFFPEFVGFRRGGRRGRRRRMRVLATHALVTVEEEGGNGLGEDGREFFLDVGHVHVEGAEDDCLEGSLRGEACQELATGEEVDGTAGGV